MIFILVAAGVFVMGPYIIRAWNANLMGWEDTLEDSYKDPFHEPSPIDLNVAGCDCIFDTFGCGLGNCSGYEWSEIATCEPMWCNYEEKIVTEYCYPSKDCCLRTEGECGAAAENIEEGCPNGWREITKVCGKDSPVARDRRRDLDDDDDDKKSSVTTYFCEEDESCLFVCAEQPQGTQICGDNEEEGLTKTSNQPNLVDECPEEGSDEDKATPCQFECVDEIDDQGEEIDLFPVDGGTRCAQCPDEYNGIDITALPMKEGEAADGCPAYFHAIEGDCPTGYRIWSPPPVMQ